MVSRGPEGDVGRHVGHSQKADSVPMDLLSVEDWGRSVVVVANVRRWLFARAKPAARSQSLKDVGRSAGAYSGMDWWRLRDDDNLAGPGCRVGASYAG